MSEVGTQRGETPGPSSRSGTSSPLLSTTRSNRQVVVMEYKIIRGGRSSNSPARDHRIMALVDQRTSDHNSCHSHQDSLEIPSSPPSRRSDCSLDTLPPFSSLVVTTGSERQILEELKNQIISSGSKAFQVEKDTQDIEKLKKIISELEKDRSRLSNELLDNQAIVGSLKQKISMLHEQNGQLVKLVQSEKGGSAEVLAVRNTLAASLAQIKKLDEQVKIIPSLKKQLQQLTEENTQLKAARLPEQLPEGIKPADYLALKSENQELHAANEKFKDKLKQLGVQLNVISSFSDALRKKMESIENSNPSNTLLEARIQSLESEKEQLYQEILDLKSHQYELQVIDSAQLGKQLTELQLVNSKLRSNLSQLKIDARQQKEQVLFGLLEVEALNIKAKKHELENAILVVEQSQHCSNEIHHRQLVSPSPEPRSLPDDDMEEFAATQPPEYKSQLLKVKQLEVHTEQLRILLQNLLSDRSELQAKMSELESLIEEKSVEELKKRLETSEGALSLAKEKITLLERELKAVQVHGKDVQHTFSENGNQELKAQLTLEQKQHLELKKSVRVLEDKCYAQKVEVEKTELLKAEKKKLEKKMKEIKIKYRTIATELTSSVELTKNYQIQCASLAEELDKCKDELKILREEHANLKAKLEIAEVEKTVGLENQTFAMEIKTRCEFLESQQALVQKKYEELEFKWQEEQRKAAEHCTEIKELNAKLVVFEQHKLKLEASLTEAGVANTKLNQDRIDLEAAVKMLENKSLDLESKLQKLQSENAELVLEVGNLNQKLAFTTNDFTTQSLNQGQQIAKLVADKDRVEEDFRKLQSENTKLMAEISSLKQNLALIKSNLDAHSQSQEQQISTLVTERGKADEILKNLNSECESFRHAVHNLQQQLAANQVEMNQRISVLQADLDRSESELDKVLAERNAIASHLDKEKHIRSEHDKHHAAELTDLHDVVKNLNAHLEQQSYSVKEKEQKLEMTEKELDQIKLQLKDVIEKKDDVSSDIKIKLKRISSLEAMHQKKVDEVKLLQQQVDSLERDIKTLKSELSNASKRGNGLNTQLDEVSASFHAEHEKSRSLERELKQLQTKEVPKLKAELEAALNEKKMAVVEAAAKQKQLSELERTMANTVQQLDALQQSSKVSIESFAHRVTSLEEALEVARNQSTIDLKRAEADHAKVVADYAKVFSENEKLLRQTQLDLEAAHLEIRNLQLESDNLRAIQKTLLAEKLDLEKRCVVIPQLEQSIKNHIEQLRKVQQRDSVQSKQLEELQNANRTLSNQVEGYTAIISSLRRKLDEAESKEMELEELKLKIKKAVGDNKQLLAILRDLPTPSTEANESLREENRKLDQQVSILSQWNDKQREKLDVLERRVDDLSAEREMLTRQLLEKEGYERENAQLKQELQEVEIEIRTLKRRAQAEFNEETKVKLKTQSQLLHMFDEHNNKLKKQVNDLVGKVVSLGGELDRRTAVSPPPMPDNCCGFENGELHPMSLSKMEGRISELVEENKTLQKKLADLNKFSASARRRSAAFDAIASISMTSEEEEVPVSVPPDMLRPLSLLADALGTSPTANTPQMMEYMNSISKGWFGCVSQKTLTLKCAECYVTTVSMLSTKLLEKVINLQDDKGNTALHYAVANEKFDVVVLLISIKLCNTNIFNNAGYTPVMLAAACHASCEGHEVVMKQLIGMGDVNARSSHDGQTALMLAASSGSLELVNILIQCGANVNLQNKDGSTALMFACENRNIEIAKRLLTVPGCNVGLEDKDKKTALKIATEAGHKEMRTLLSGFFKSTEKSIKTKW